jgi:hypothetical protein
VGAAPGQVWNPLLLPQSAALRCGHMCGITARGGAAGRQQAKGSALTFAGQPVDVVSLTLPRCHHYRSMSRQGTTSEQGPVPDVGSAANHSPVLGHANAWRLAARQPAPWLCPPTPRTPRSSTGTPVLCWKAPACGQTEHSEPGACVLTCEGHARGSHHGNCNIAHQADAGELVQGAHCTKQKGGKGICVGGVLAAGALMQAAACRPCEGKHEGLA